MRLVRVHPDFEADFVAQLDWLVRHREREWIVKLRDGLERVIGLVARFPGAGTLVDERAGIALRKVFWPSGPYVAWYIYDQASSEGDIWFVRLFHARQTRPRPDPGKWLPGRRRLARR